MNRMIFVLFSAFAAGSFLGIALKPSVMEVESKEDGKTEGIVAYPQPIWYIQDVIGKKDLRLGAVLSDIRSHISDGGYYDDGDKVTSGHETTHGINSMVRNKLYKGKPINAFYCLDGKVSVLDEPRTRIEVVAREVPRSLRGGVYGLYMVEQASTWGDRALYILDEWVCYTNGSAVRKDLGMSGRAETVLYMLEFDVYVMTLAKVLEDLEPGYSSGGFKDFVRWNVERSMSLYGGEREAGEYLAKLRGNADAAGLRSFMIGYFGRRWCVDVLGVGGV